MDIKLPYKFTARPYQQEVMDIVMGGKIKRFLNVWHRRAGKDRVWFNIMVMLAIKKTGLYVHSYRSLPHARKAIWEGIMPDGTRFLDHIPKQFLKKKPNETELKLEFINGSIIRLAGTDNYNSWVGTNPVWVTFAEYSVQNPMAWTYIRPILRENGGGAAFLYTPRGHNHGYHLYRANIDNPKWYVNKLSINDTQDIYGNSIMTDEDIKEEIRSGMSRNMALQEFYCDFDSSVDGAVFTNEIRRATDDGRIKDFSFNRNNPVYTFWDLGRTDPTAIWFIQYNHEKEIWDAIYYYENQDNGIKHYIRELRKVADKLNIVYGGHFAPHDIMKQSYELNISTLQFASNLGIDFMKVDRVPFLQDGIERARSVFDNVRFHKTNCEEGVNALKSYTYNVNQSTREYGRPKHDWASHGASAFMTFACAPKIVNNYPAIVYDVVNTC